MRGKAKNMHSNFAKNERRKGESDFSIFSRFILVNLLSSESMVNKSSLQLLKQASYDISLQRILQLKTKYFSIRWYCLVCVFCLWRHLFQMDIYVQASHDEASQVSGDGHGVCVCYECCSRKALQHLTHCSYTVSKSLSLPCKWKQTGAIKM